MLWARYGEPIERWTGGQRSEADAVEAWQVAVHLRTYALRITVWRALVFTALPVMVYVTVVFDLDAGQVAVITGAMLTAACYPIVFNFFGLEIYARPVIEELAAALPQDFEFTRPELPLRLKLYLSLPLINAVTTFLGVWVTNADQPLETVGPEVLVRW
ncbi:MAG: hypothetical protein H0V29_11080 [Thermoleophilaceae bacterium]|nr:hypothetical protein [Thermoleophilaceae bacterium]